MKPDWKDAPEWANWLAMDATGHWFWYEDRPILSPVDWMPGGKFSFAGSSTMEWENTLSSRPDTTKPAEAGSEGQGA